jgi:rhodanese-related sulfurtransferase
MKHFALNAMSMLLAILTLTAAVPGFADTPAALPEGKRTHLQLYMTPREAYDAIREDPAHTLFLDVRTRAEAMYVGMATPVDALVPYLEHQELMTDWDEVRNIYMMEPNSDFVTEAERRLKAKGLTKADRVILMCRSGDRSARATDRLTDAGFSRVYSVTEGFEGDLLKDGPKAGQRALNGWKNAGLPWGYKLTKAKMYFPH